MLQDIADLAFRSSQGRPLVSLSFSVMVADTVISILVESIFLIQVRPGISGEREGGKLIDEGISPATAV